MKRRLLSFAMLAASLVSVSAQEHLMLNNGMAVPASEIKSIRHAWSESMQPSGSLSQLMKNDNRITLFAKAIEATGWDKELGAVRDDAYSVGADSINWTNPALVIHTAAEYDNVAYMPIRYVNRTAFVETDSVYAVHGIKTLEELNNYAHSLYDVVYPEDASVSDMKDKRNALNRFVGYHILPFKAGYYQLTAVDGDLKDQKTSPTITKCFARTEIDIADWYETLSPHSLMKFSFPSGSDYGLYINRRGVQSREDERGVFVRGSKIMTEGDLCGDASMEEPLCETGANGYYYFIDDIIAYDENTQKVVLNERMRIDCTTLSPDFITSGARGHYARNGAGSKNGKYAPGGQQAGPYTNNATCLGFKSGAAKNFEFNDNNTHLHVRNRFIDFWSYGGDELIVKGQFDVTIKLPPVPAGTYEVRLGTCTGFNSRGIIQFYLDDQPTGVPIDFRPSGENLFGFQSDKSLGTPEAIAEADKMYRNQGWMKGPGSYRSGSAGWSDSNQSFRNQNNTVRAIICHFDNDGKTDHYLRLKQVLESGESEINLDFIEIVPKDVYDNPDVPEDIW